MYNWGIGWRVFYKTGWGSLSEGQVQEKESVSKESPKSKKKGEDRVSLRYPRGQLTREGAGWPRQVPVVPEDTCPMSQRTLGPGQSQGHLQATVEGLEEGWERGGLVAGHGAHACNPSTLVDYLRSGVQDQSNQHGETPSLPKIQN